MKGWMLKAVLSRSYARVQVCRSRRAGPLVRPRSNRGRGLAPEPPARDTVARFTGVVVGYDGSPGSRAALHTALRLAHESGGTLTPVTVRHHLPRYGATTGEVGEEREVEAAQARQLTNETRRSIVVDPAATGGGARGAFIWWSTGDNETLTWHGIDLRTLS